MMRITIPTLLVLTVSAALSAPASEASWPCWRGPHGNGSGEAIDVPLIQDLAQARVVWRSQEAIPDSYVADARSGSKAAGVNVGGGFAAPLVVGDAVYQFYYLPSGEVVDEAAAQKNAGRDRGNWRVLADDILVCIDAATGKTRWRAIMAGKGINVTAAFNKGGGLLTPCYGDGRVYAVGTGALVYAIEASSGQPVWEQPLGQRHADMQEAREKALADGKLIYFNRDLGGAVAYADGVVCSNDYAEYYTKRNDVGGGLAAFDAATGAPRWAHPACADWHACPIVWRHDGTAYFLIANKQQVTCIEARSGRIAWTSTEAGCGVAVAVAGDRLICNGAKTGKEYTQGLSCFELTPSGARKLWSLGPETAIGSGAPTVHRERVYVSGKDAFWCVALADGAVVGKLPALGVYASPVAMGGRVLVHGDGKGGNCMRMFRAEGSAFEVLGELPEPVIANSTSAAVVGSAMFVRGRDRLWCVDLRAR